MGFCLNTLPLRTPLNDADNFSETLARVKRVVLAGLCRAICRSKSWSRWRLVRDAQHTPLYQVMFVLVEEGVAVHLHRSMDFVVSVLGILKAGGAYVPLDLNYPADRLRFMLVDSGAKAIVTKGPLPAGLARKGLGVLDLQQAATLVAANPTADPAPSSGADDLAYVMYTSGSTGWPKGVGIPHRGVVRLVRGQEYAEFDPSQRFMFLRRRASTHPRLSCGGRCSTGPHASSSAQCLSISRPWNSSFAHNKSPASG